MSSSTHPIDATTGTSATSIKSKVKQPLEIIFIHLDLGIGGAEQLILSLACASQDAGHSVTIVTSHCSQDHCFSQVRKPHGRLADRVRVWGDFLPANIGGKGTALCSTIRMLYLSYWLAKAYSHADVVVLDVLPTPIPFFLIPYFSVLFYCHFPDKLLTRDTVNGEAVEAPDQSVSRWNWRRHVAQFYRSWLDQLEETTMAYADILVVNSKFTLTQVHRVFASLRDKPTRVLYPALQHHDTVEDSTVNNNNNNNKNSNSPIVSLNRFERKKNIALLLHAYKELERNVCDSQITLPPLIIAGGYDTLNVENVEYMAELRNLVEELQLATVTFAPNLPDAERLHLFRTALCVVYTPHLEHFGIVPLEAMAAGTPVVAVRSGGPMETILDGKTGFLCHATPQAFATALETLVRDPSKATQMGKTGRDHVVQTFGQERFQQEWQELIEETVAQGKLRRQQGRRYTMWNGIVYLFEAFIMLILVVILTWILRVFGILSPESQIIGTLRRAFSSREEL